MAEAKCIARLVHLVDHDHTELVNMDDFSVLLSSAKIPAISLFSQPRLSHKSIRTITNLHYLIHQAFNDHNGQR